MCFNKKGIISQFLEMYFLEYNYIGGKTNWSVQASIAPTFYEPFIWSKVLRKTFLYLHFRFELFSAEEYWRKYTHKMLVKLTIGVHFTNILQAAFWTKAKRTVYLYFKISFKSFGAKKLSEKLLLKCWWNWLQLAIRKKSYIQSHKRNLVLKSLD
jgi:hypothetical protein